MKQKTIWMLFLAIGLISFLFSCGKRIIEYKKTVNYIYKNESASDLKMEVYNSSVQLIKSYDISSGTQMITHSTQEEGVLPFYFDSYVDSIGDSVVIIFSNNKCQSYSKSNPELDKIFRAKNYDNYSEELMQEKEFDLFYTFSDTDLNQAENCDSQ